MAYSGDLRSSGPEVHLFVVWEHGRYAADRIVADVQRHFRVLAGFEVHWTQSPTARHFSRLYGQSLPPGSDKALRCGYGPFLLLVVEDADPRYGSRRKWGQKVVVNTRMFDAKERYRSWTDGHRVHNSTDQLEADRDLFVLLGRRREEFEGQPTAWDGTFVPIVRDPAGTDGWRSVDELCTAVELTLPYVLLPDPEPSPDRLRMLVEASFDAWGVEWLLAAPEDVPLAERGPVYPVVVAGRGLSLDLRRVGDGDLPAAWQAAVLRDRVRDASGAYVLPPMERYTALLHACVTRGLVDVPEQVRLLDAAGAAAGLAPAPHGDPAARAAFLEDLPQRWAATAPEVPEQPRTRLRRWLGRLRAQRS